MTSFSLFGLMQQILGSLCQILLKPVCRWIKPDNHAPIPNAALDLMRSKSELMLENALLRQQVIVLQRQTKRPKVIDHRQSRWLESLAAQSGQEDQEPPKAAGQPQGLNSHASIQPVRCQAHTVPDSRQSSF